MANIRILVPVLTSGLACIVYTAIADEICLDSTNYVSVLENGVLPSRMGEQRHGFTFCMAKCKSSSFCKDFHYTMTSRTCTLIEASGEVLGKLIYQPDTYNGVRPGNVGTWRGQCRRTRYRYIKAISTCLSYQMILRNWHGARRACQNQGASLVTIKNGLKQANIAAIIPTLMPAGRRTNYWIGSHDVHNNGYFWLDGSQVAYNSWSQGQPSFKVKGTGRNEDCVQMMRNGRWRDVECRNRARYICELS